MKRAVPRRGAERSESHRDRLNAVARFNRLAGRQSLSSADNAMHGLQCRMVFARRRVREVPPRLRNSRG